MRQGYLHWWRAPVRRVGAGCLRCRGGARGELAAARGPLPELLPEADCSIEGVICMKQRGQRRITDLLCNARLRIGPFYIISCITAIAQ